MSAQAAAEFLMDAGASVLSREAQQALFGAARADWTVSVPNTPQTLEKTDGELIEFAKKCGWPGGTE